MAVVQIKFLSAEKMTSYQTYPPNTLLLIATPNNALDKMETLCTSFSQPKIWKGHQRIYTPPNFMVLALVVFLSFVIA